VGAAFVFQAAVSAPAFDLGDDLLEAAHAARRRRTDDFHLPALRFGIARIHPEQIAGKQTGFIAAGSRADFQKDVFVVVGVFGQQQDLDFFFQRGKLLLQLGHFLFGQRLQFFVALRKEFLVLSKARLDLFIAADRIHQFG